MGHDNKIYIFADPHFGHKKLIESGTSGRPWRTIEEHDEALVTYWNQTVRPKDTVIVAGDVYFGGSENHKILKKLHGIKKLILGNHDVYPLEYYQKYFTKIFSSIKIHGVLISHIPIILEDTHSYHGNIHGHLHLKTIPDNRYQCVSAEQVYYRPILLDEVIHRIPLDFLYKR